jgi:hypothetical protein
MNTKIRKLEAIIATYSKHIAFRFVRQDNENQETRYNRQGLKKMNIDGWNII